MTTQGELEAQIEKLEAERHSLQAREGAGDEHQQEDVARLEAIRVELDRLFDLKRRRWAVTDAGGDPDSVEERPAGTVENYLQ